MRAGNQAHQQQLLESALLPRQILAAHHQLSLIKVTYHHQLLLIKVTHHTQLLFIKAIHHHRPVDSALTIRNLHSTMRSPGASDLNKDYRYMKPGESPTL